MTFLYRVQAFEHSCWRWIQNVSYLNNVSNKEIRQRMGNLVPSSPETQRRRLMYLGNVLRMDPRRLTHVALMAKAATHWTRGLGATWCSTSKTWHRSLHTSTLCNLGLDTGEVSSWIQRPIGINGGRSVRPGCALRV